MTHDDVAARLIKRLLLRDNRLSSQHIDVTVQDGCVSLRGRVSSAAAKAAADELASNLPGVCAVLNEIDIVPPSSLPDPAVAENVRAALEAHPRLVKDAITVSVHDGNVNLNGTVSGDEERLLALDIALGASGVRRLEDWLLIDAIRKIEDSALAREMRKAILDALPDPESRVRVAISGGMCVLSGRVATDALKRSVEAIARKFAVTTLRNEIQVETQSSSIVAPDRSSPPDHRNAER